jgi:hypothetical protein
MAGSGLAMTQKVPARIISPIIMPGLEPGIHDFFLLP